MFGAFGAGRRRRRPLRLPEMAALLAAACSGDPPPVPGPPSLPPAATAAPAPAPPLPRPPAPPHDAAPVVPPAALTPSNVVDVGGAPAWAPAPGPCRPFPLPGAPTGPALRAALAAVRAGRADPIGLEMSCEVPAGEVARAFNEGGLVAHRAGDFESSRRRWATALTIDPSLLPARFNLACALARLGRHDAAIAQLRELHRAGEPGQEWLRRALTDSDLASLRDRPDWQEGFALVPPTGAPPMSQGEAAALALGAPPSATPTVQVLAAHGPVLPFAEAAPTAPPGAEPPVFVPRSGPWAPVRDLLVATTELSQGRRAFQPRGGLFRAEPAQLPRTVTRDGLREMFRVGFWRPSPTATFLLVPFGFAGANGTDEGYGLYLTSAAGVQLVRHVRIDAEESCEDAESPAFTAALTRDEREIREAHGCAGETGSVCHVRLEAGALHAVCWHERFP